MTNTLTLEQLLEAGAHFGHQARRWNPAMKRYIYGQKDGVHIFDLVKTKLGFDEACEFLAGLVKEGKVILLVGTKRQANEAIKKLGMETGFPYVNVRWMGGTLTNFGQIRKSVSKMRDLMEKKEKGELKKYTKKEQLLLDRDMGKLAKFFGGVAMMDKLPDALFVVDTHREEVAVLEAKRMGIPVVGICDTNSNPVLVDFVIPMNDDADKAVELAINVIGEVLKKKPEKNEISA